MNFLKVIMNVVWTSTLCLLTQTKRLIERSSIHAKCCFLLGFAPGIMFPLGLFEGVSHVYIFWFLGLGMTALTALLLNTKGSFVGMVLGVLLGFPSVNYTYTSSSEYQAKKLTEELDRQYAISSGTLRSEKYRYGELDDRYRHAVVLNQPEPIGEGSLMVLRVKMEADHVPKMIFYNPSGYEGCESPKIGEEIGVNPKYFRGVDYLSRAPIGAPAERVMYFAVPKKCK